MGVQGIQQDGQLAASDEQRDVSDALGRLREGYQNVPGEEGQERRRMEEEGGRLPGGGDS